MSVVPANIHDLAVTTEHESAGMESGATDAPKAHPCLHGFSDDRQARMSPASGTHPWHQISISSSIMGRHFQVRVGTHGIPRNAGLDSCPGFHRGKLGIAEMTG